METYTNDQLIELYRNAKTAEEKADLWKHIYITRQARTEPRRWVAICSKLLLVEYYNSEEKAAARVAEWEAELETSPNDCEAGPYYTTADEYETIEEQLALTMNNENK